MYGYLGLSSIHIIKWHDLNKIVLISRVWFNLTRTADLVAVGHPTHSTQTVSDSNSAGLVGDENEAREVWRES